MVIVVTNSPCDCPPGKCAAMFNEDDRGECVNRVGGNVLTIYCQTCQAHTWHKDDNCLRCEALSKEPHYG